MCTSARSVRWVYLPAPIKWPGALPRRSQLALRKNPQNWQQFVTVVISGPPLHSHCARARDPTSTIIITPGEVESPLPRDRCGVTAISIILPTLLYVSNAVVSPRTNNKESLRRPAARERTKERERGSESAALSSKLTSLRFFNVYLFATRQLVSSKCRWQFSTRLNASIAQARQRNPRRRAKSVTRSYFNLIFIPQRSCTNHRLLQVSLGSIQPCVILW